MKNKRKAPQFNWVTELRRLIALEKRGGKARLSTTKKLDLLAKGWPTCACGQLCKLLPRFVDRCGTKTTAPADAQLRDLGRIFYRKVRFAKWREALNIFLMIEKRSSELLVAMV